MKKLFKSLLATAAVAFMLAATGAHAHHSLRGIAIEHKVSLAGVLTEIRFTAPHVMLKFETTRDDGAIEEWEIESKSPSRLGKLGSDRPFIKVGEEATFTGFPARNCTNFMALSAIEIEGKGTLMVVEEIAQPGARAAVPDEAEICENWPELITAPTSIGA